MYNQNRETQGGAASLYWVLSLARASGPPQHLYPLQEWSFMMYQLPKSPAIGCRECPDDQAKQDRCDSSLSWGEIYTEGRPGRQVDN